MKRLLIILGCATILSGCQQKVVYLDENGNEVDPPQQKQKEYLDGSGERFELVKKVGKHLSEIRDTETGVHYLYLRQPYSGGGLSITPVYEADGSVKVTEVK